ncbi:MULTISPECIES: hypothetical protein [Rhodococcus erythropolis group]|uniref:Uncharacterized protein n=1 Tax=Rhodococcus erythropolis TaxID=1833 RepID=A0A8I0ZX91_RHOER|nr:MULTISPECIES: hypothetical protein [Rhodococcus erythropolis group]MBH5144298.1 hypothetical protein [Rhodococcus erythropolis]MDJ0434754.1 hypothetical protein [Rhodococcus qingshengii]QEM25767.1 hypothetical protein D6M20_02730 [Rhodococcus qingshengii]
MRHTYPDIRIAAPGNVHCEEADRDGFADPADRVARAGLVVRNDVRVTHRLLQTVRRLSDGMHGLALGVQYFVVE